ncbi:MAG: acetate/propionate family kinase [Burkholderiales bacterium]|nr:acetate/propionate family kinase [Burkholderiales bacterium]
MTDVILVLNAGSSSIKFSVFAAHEQPSRQGLICEGECDGIGHRAHFVACDHAGRALADQYLAEGATHEDALAGLLNWLESHFHDDRLVAAGHRVVHGGARYSAPVRIDATVIAALRELIPLAPLHQPHHLAAIDALARLHPALPQIAAFDTAFHHTQAPVATAFALPDELTAQHIRRYGFHGLSYEYIAGVLPGFIGAEAAEGRIVVAHLGAGASMCGMIRRQSVVTTMGFTALDGLPMGRRCGNLDPGVVLYLMEERGMSPGQIRDLLYNHSGLLGVSGISDDMRTLQASDDPRAARAIDLFVYRIGRELGSLAAALGGLDALVFTAGIGEHAVEIRRRVCLQAAWLGLRLDEAANERGGPCLTRPGSGPSAWVIPTDEDLMIARHTWQLISNT